MAYNKIITSEGNVQFQTADGSIINVHPFHIYTTFNEDTVSFILIAMPKQSGLAIFTSKASDLEVDGTVYTIEQLPNALSEAFAKAGAVARYEIVDELPTSGQSNTIYLVPKSEGIGYDEYIYVNGEWELIGDTDIELDRYVDKETFSGYTADTLVLINTVSGNVITESERAISAETALQTAIDNEVSARTDADEALEDYIDAVSGAVDNVQDEVDILSAALEDEVSARTQADEALDDKIDGKVVELTQQQYDQLQDIDPLVLYVITDAVEVNMADYYKKTETSGATEISTALNAKQDTLISGTNIKTINNESILGSGNINIQGGGITSGEVQTMIDESISGKTNQNDNLFTIRTNVIETVVVAGGAKLGIIFAFDIIQNNQIVLSTDTVNDKSSLLSALATLGFDNKIYDIRGINYSESTLKTSYFGECLGHKCYEVLLGYVPDFGSITIGLKRNNVYYTLDSVGSGKYNYNYLSNKPSITTSITSASTDSEIPSAKAVNDKLGGLSIVKMTQSEYDSLTTKDNSTLYIIIN